MIAPPRRSGDRGPDMSIAPRIARRGLIHREVYTKYTMASAVRTT
jgi:hypothetical protein